MKKGLSAAVLLLLACLLAGLYGGLHNQVSYTVAPEYFTKFKFHQFQIGATLHSRYGAAIVGWRASWWMGLVVGALVLPVSMWGRDLRCAFTSSLKAFAVVVVVAFLTGLTGLLCATLYFDEASAGVFVRYGNEIKDNVAFARAGAMHNCSYVGGVLGLLSAWFYLGRLRWKAARVALATASDKTGTETNSELV